MTQVSPEPATGGSPSVNCLHLKELGYVVGKHINMYGEHIVLVSDPFDDGDCVAVRAVSAENPVERTVDLPVTLLAGWEDLFLEPADPAALEAAVALGGPSQPAAEQNPEQLGKE
jgi:hypothetical protein